MTHLTVLGRQFHLEVEPAVLEWLRQYFEFPETAHLLSSDWKIDVTQQSALPAQAPRALAQLLPGVGETRTVARQGNVLWLFDEETAACLELDETRQHVTLHLFGAAFTDWLTLMRVICEALRFTGLLPLHAAATTKDKEGLLFLGPSGRGKSTTLLQAALAGWQPVSEDFCWLEPQGQRLFGLDRHLRLLSESLSLVQTNLTPTGMLNGKHVISYDDLGGRAWSCALSKVVLLERDVEKTTAWQPLRAGAGVAALYSATGIPLTERGKTVTSAAFAKVAKEAVFVRLVLGQGAVRF
jgi:hypothetical protein